MPNTQIQSLVSERAMPMEMESYMQHQFVCIILLSASERCKETCLCLHGAAGGGYGIDFSKKLLTASNLGLKNK